MFSSNADARVAHAEQAAMLFIDAPLQSYRAPLWRITHGIARQIAKCTAQFIRATGNGGAVVNRQFNGVSARAQRACVFGQPLQQHSDIHTLFALRAVATLQPRQH